MPGPAGLSNAHRAEARRVILLGVRLLMAHPAQIHYSQGPDRWEGIAKKLRIADGEYPKHGDCSSTHTWLVWNALTHVGAMQDHVNGQHYRAGFTGTIGSHGIVVPSVRHAKVGDAVLYGPRPTYEHIATYIGGGRVFSHGSERGPFLLGIDYRGDRAVIRRHF
jgi:hypothetical protein